MYKSSQPTPRGIEQCVQGVEGRITNEMRRSLDRDFIKEEVATGFFQMSPFKSPGLDGFRAGFFQDHWALVGDEVTHAFLDFLKNANMPRDLNHAFLVLIPKVNSPTTVHDYCPISLCNVLYKLRWTWQKLMTG